MKLQLVKEANRAAARDTRRRWNAEFEKFGHKYGLQEAELARFAVEKGYLKGDMQILEVGTGSGRNTLYFARNGLQVTSIDISDAAIALLCSEIIQDKKLNGHVNSFRLDFFDALRFLKAENFDVIVFNFCFHLFSKKLRRKFLRISSALLKPNGLLILSLLSTADNDYPRAKIGEFGTPIEDKTWIIRNHPQHFFDKEELEQLFKAGKNGTSFSLVHLEALNELERIITETRKTSFWVAIGRKEAKMT